MSDEIPAEIAYVEMLAVMPALARLFHEMRVQLVQEGESEADALALTRAYIHGLAGGKLS